MAQCCKLSTQPAYETNHLDHTTGPGCRHDACNICLETIQPCESSLSHSDCLNAWHRSCLTQYIESNIGEYSDESAVQCVMCRETIANYRPQHCSELYCITTLDQEAIFEQSIVQFLKVGYRLTLTPAADILDADILPANDVVHLFYAEHVWSRADEHSTGYRIPPGRSDATFFREIDSIEPAALIVDFCEHQSQCYLLTAQQVYNTLSLLYNGNWDPLTGRSVPRINRYIAQSQSLSGVILQAIALGVSDITSFELKALFPSYFEGLFDGLLPHIRIRYAVDHRGRRLHEVQATTLCINPAPLVGMDCLSEQAEWDDILKRFTSVMLQDLGGPPSMIIADYVDNVQELYDRYFDCTNVRYPLI